MTAPHPQYPISPKESAGACARASFSGLKISVRTVRAETQSWQESPRLSLPRGKLAVTTVRSKNGRLLYGI